MPKPFNRDDTPRHQYRAGSGHSGGGDFPRNKRRRSRTSSRPQARGEDGAQQFAGAEGQPHSSAPRPGQKRRNNSRENTNKFPQNIIVFAQENTRKLLIAGAAILLVIILLLVMLIPSCTAGKDPGTSLASGGGSLPLGEALGETAADENYNKDKYALNTEEFVDTILPETADAGEAYVTDTLFLGDSNTVRMISYRDVTDVTLENGIGVEGMGIQSFTSLGAARFEGISNLVTMAEAVAILQPRRVVITFGTNNVGGMAVDTFISHYKQALDAIHDAYEYADIIIGAVFPVDANCRATGITMTKIDQYNVALAELADQEGYKFLYWSEALKDANTGYCVSSYTVSDGYHISRDGMEALFTYLRTHSYVTEDKRPKPLKAIPKRIAEQISLITSDGNTDTAKASSSSSSSSSGSSSVVTATAQYAVGKDGGGTLKVGKENYASYTVEVAVGEMTPEVTAVPKDGYKFSHWTTSVSGLDTKAKTIGGITVKEKGTLTFTAVFVKDSTTTTSQTPTTQAPTTQAPTTAPPTTAPPTTQAPTTAPPTTTQPPTTAPSSQAPVTETPSSTEKPATELPVDPDPDPDPGPEPETPDGDGPAAE